MSASTTPELDHDSERAQTARDRAETRKFIAESNKLAAEQLKFSAEQFKLYAEAEKFRRERFLAPVLAAAVLGGALAAAIPLLLRALGAYPPG